MSLLPINLVFLGFSMLTRCLWWVGADISTCSLLCRSLKRQASKTARQTIHWPTIPLPFPSDFGMLVSVD